MFNPHCDPVIYFSTWMSDTICRQYLTHFSEHQWLLVAKYTLLLGLGYFQKLGLNIFQMCLKTPEDPIDRSPRENKETSIKDLEIKTKMLKTFFCEAHVLQKCKAIPKIILNKKNLQCSTLLIKGGDQYDYQRDVSGDSKMKLTNYKMYKIFRRFFLQFPEKTWSHFIKIFFVFGIHSISLVNITLHTLSLDILRSLLIDYEAVLETKNQCSITNTQGNSSIMKNPHGVLQRTNKKIQPFKIFQRTLTKKREPELNQEQQVFPFQFISSAFLGGTNSLSSVYPDWWNDEECLSLKSNKTQSFLNRFTTLKAQQAVQFMKKQQRFNHFEKRQSKILGASTYRIKGYSIKKKENRSFHLTNEESGNSDECPKVSFLLSQSLHVYSLDPFSTKNCNVKSKSNTETNSKQLLNSKKTFIQQVRNVNDNSLQCQIKEKSMAGHNLMCNVTKNSLSYGPSGLTDGATKSEVSCLPKMSRTMALQNFKENSKSFKSIEFKKASSKPILGGRPSLHVYETQGRQPLQSDSGANFLYARTATTPNGRTDARHVCSLNHGERVLKFRDTIKQNLMLFEQKVPQGARQQFENRPCFHRVSYNARESATLPLHLLCHSFQQ